MKDFSARTPKVFGALQLKAEAAFQNLDVAMRDYGFVKGTFLNELENLHEREIGLLCTRT